MERREPLGAGRRAARGHHHELVPLEDAGGDAQVDDLRELAAKRAERIRHRSTMVDGSRRGLRYRGSGSTRIPSTRNGSVCEGEELVVARRVAVCPELRVDQAVLPEPVAHAPGLLRAAAVRADEPPA